MGRRLAPDEGSSDIRWGSWGESPGSQEHAEAVAVAAAAGETAVQLDDAHGFGAAVVRTVGAEAGQERLPPAAQGPSQPGDLTDRAGVERVEDLLGAPASVGGVLGTVGRAQVLRAAPGEVDLLVRDVGEGRVLEAP